MMTTEEKIAVLSAFALSKGNATVQFRGFGFEKWHDCAVNVPYWDFSRNDYRLKPEPREWWVNVYRADLVNDIAHASRAQADHYACNGRKECVRVREVLE